MADQTIAIEMKATTAAAVLDLPRATATHAIKQLEARLGRIAINRRDAGGALEALFIA